MQKNLKRVISIYFMISICLCFSACGSVNEEQPVEESEANISGEYNFQLESSEDKIEQLTENIKTSYESDETNSYNILNQETVENDWTKYGEMETVHEEFPNEDGSVPFIMIWNVSILTILIQRYLMRRFRHITLLWKSPIYKIHKYTQNF